MKQISTLRLALATLALLMLSACPPAGDNTNPSASPSQNTSTSPAPVNSQNPSPTVSQASAAPAGIKRGIFVLGDDYQVFKACGQKEEIWVQDTAGKELTNQYKALHLMELEPVYVEIAGDIKPTGKSQGFAADYKQTLHVKKLLSLKTWVSNGSCFPTDFVAQGSPPDWSLQVLRSGDVFFKSNEGEFPFVDTLAYSPPKQEGNHWRYEFHFRTPDEAILKADFAEESCTQGSASFRFSTKIEFRGSTYTGCAKKLF